MSNATYKVAVIGDRETVMGFSALGLKTVVAENAREASEALETLSKQQVGIIYITEQLAAGATEAIAELEENPQCAVIPIPSKAGSLGIGVRDMHKAVEKAVGADILKEKES